MLHFKIQRSSLLSLLNFEFQFPTFQISIFIISSKPTKLTHSLSPLFIRFPHSHSHSHNMDRTKSSSKSRPSTADLLTWSEVPHPESSPALSASAPRSHQVLYPLSCPHSFWRFRFLGCLVLRFSVYIFSRPIESVKCSKGVSSRMKKPRA